MRANIAWNFGDSEGILIDGLREGKAYQKSSRRFSKENLLCILSTKANKKKDDEEEDGKEEGKRKGGRVGRWEREWVWAGEEEKSLFDDVSMEPRLP